MGNWGLDVSSTRGVVDLLTGRWIAPHLGIGKSHKEREKDRRKEQVQKKIGRQEAGLAAHNRALTEGTFRPGAAALTDRPTGASVLR